MAKTIEWIVLVCLFAVGRGQTGKGNANTYMDDVLIKLRNVTSDSIRLKQHDVIVIIDLVLLKPELHIELKDGEMKGFHSLARSSDAEVTYNETSGLPIYTVDFSLRLSNISMNSNVSGKVLRAPLDFPLPTIKQKAFIQMMDFRLAIDMNLKNFSDLKVSTRDVEVTNIGEINLGVVGLTPELDALASPISSLLVNAVKRDLRGLVAPFIQDTLDRVLQKNIPKDISGLFG